MEDPGKKSPRKLDSWYETIEGYGQDGPSNYKPSTKMGIQSETGKDPEQQKEPGKSHKSPQEKNGQPETDEHPAPQKEPDRPMNYRSKQ